MANIGKTLWDFIMTLLKGIQHVWSFLNQEIAIGKFEIFGQVVWEGFTFTPMHLSGVIIVALIVFGLVKTFVPVA